MLNLGVHPSRYGLEQEGFRRLKRVYWNLTPSALVEHAIRKGEGILAANGALVVTTGRHTGRSPKDKFIVRTPEVEQKIWWGLVNQPFEPERFDSLYQRVLTYLEGKELFVQDCFAGADERYRLPIRVITQYAWHSLFARQLFVHPQNGVTSVHKPQFAVLCVPGFQAEPERDGTRSETFILLNFSRRLILIGGTEYAGEIKKSIFTVMNFLMPEQGVCPMHCAANMGEQGDTVLFFGLSGTGKTSLSADVERRLIGDDEHVWSDDGIFNIEGGCYAKCIRLSKENEPQIWNAIRFGAVLENVVIDQNTRELDFNDDSLTENTRAAYPLEFIEGAVTPSLGGHPRHLFFLTCDAFGVLPPIARLTTEQAMQQFLLGYTAKVAGTERGVTEPQATFSTCFGAPFLPLPPKRYADLLGERIKRHKAQVWLVNTGWSGGAYGIGQRIQIQYTRAMIRAALRGQLNEVEYRVDPVFRLQVPQTCPGVPPELFNPRATWKDGAAYDLQARKLAAMWEEQAKQIG